MCFSSEASFTATVLLTATGVINLKLNKEKTLFPLACTPFLFALQQASEGFIWIGETHPGFPQTFSKLAMLLFLSFAFLFWPIWIPFATWYAEKEKDKKNILFMILCLGVLVSLISLAIVPKNSFRAEIVNGNLHYGISSPFAVNVQMFTILYILSILLPCIVSSLKGMKLFGSLVAISVAVSHFIYYETFTSVWCFFAALISVSLIVVILANGKEESEEAQNIKEKF